MPSFVYEKQEDIFPSQIVTDRLLFRKIEYGVLDTDEIYNKYSELSDEETQFVTFNPYENRKQVKDFIDDSIKKFNEGESASYFLFNTMNYDFIGTASFDPSWEKSIAESGVFLFKDYWGNGYSTERGKAMVEMAFEEYDFKHWISKCHPENKGSIGAIQKYVVQQGGEKVGVLPNWLTGLSSNLKYDDIMYFKLSRKDYFADSAD